MYWPDLEDARVSVQSVGENLNASLSVSQSRLGRRCPDQRGWTMPGSIRDRGLAGGSGDVLRSPRTLGALLQRIRGTGTWS